LYLANFLALAVREPALYRILTFHVSNRMSFTAFENFEIFPLETLSPEKRMGEWFASGLFYLQRKHLIL
jgi:hypothetical protein